MKMQIKTFYFHDRILGEKSKKLFLSRFFGGRENKNNFYFHSRLFGRENLKKTFYFHAR